MDDNITSFYIRASKIGNRFIGFCIYCGSKESLSGEHVVPFALSGSHTLSLGSCEVCRRVTNSFEQPVLRGLLHDYRVYKDHQSRSNFQSFNPIREYLVRAQSGLQEKRKLHLNQVGLYLFVPEFEQPKFLTGDTSSGVKLKRFVIFSAKSKPYNRPRDINEVKIRQNFPTSRFIRFLCKIGLGYVYLRGKDKGFKSFVTDLILGKSDAEDWVYVGSPSKSKFKDNEMGVKLFEQGNYLLAEIKLFEDLLARYLIVLGEV